MRSYCTMAHSSMPASRRVVERVTIELNISACLLCGEMAPQSKIGQPGPGHIKTFLPGFSGFALTYVLVSARVQQDERLIGSLHALRSAPGCVQACGRLMQVRCQGVSIAGGRGLRAHSLVAQQVDLCRVQPPFSRRYSSICCRTYATCVNGMFTISTSRITLTGGLGLAVNPSNASKERIPAGRLLSSSEKSPARRPDTGFPD